MQNRDSESAETHVVGLLGALDDFWLKLLPEAMREVGPAAQTLAGVLTLTRTETFVSADAIASAALVPVATARKHLITLGSRGWITNAGRQKTRAGAPRRTCTIKVTQKTRDATSRYLVLPWFACVRAKGFPSLTWASRAVLAVVMSRLLKLKATAKRSHFEPNDESEIWDAIDDLLGGEERFRFSLRQLESETGLTRETIITAKRQLHAARVVTWQENQDEHGHAESDSLLPNRDFRVVRKTLQNGHVRTSCEG